MQLVSPLFSGVLPPEKLIVASPSTLPKHEILFWLQLVISGVFGSEIMTEMFSEHPKHPTLLTVHVYVSANKLFNEELFPPIMPFELLHVQLQFPVPPLTFIDKLPSFPPRQLTLLIFVMLVDMGRFSFTKIE